MLPDENTMIRLTVSPSFKAKAKAKANCRAYLSSAFPRRPVTELMWIRKKTGVMS